MICRNYPASPAKAIIRQRKPIVTGMCLVSGLSRALVDDPPAGSYIEAP